MKWTLMTPLFQIEFDDEDMLPKSDKWTPRELLEIPADDKGNDGTLYYEDLPMHLIPDDSKERGDAWWDALRTKVGLNARH